MDQIHRRFSTDHVKHLLRGYTEGLLERPEAISRNRPQRSVRREAAERPSRFLPVTARNEVTRQSQFEMASFRSQ
jgi:hypothetical protein